MTFHRSRLELPGSTQPQPAHLFRECSKCNDMRAPEGGIELRPGKWVCHSCWTKRVWSKK